MQRVAGDGQATPEALGSETRERILIEASKLFARQGYAGTTTRAIADAVQIRQPSLFHHFGSKAAIMDELLCHSLSVPTQVANDLAIAKGSPAARLGRYLRFDIEHIYSSPYDLVGLHRQEVMDLPAFDEWRRMYDQLRAARRRLIADGMKAGEFIELDVDLADDAITGLVLGTLGGRSRRALAPKLAAEVLAEFALRALRRDGPR
jgi:AcrR family transcriptional regulator